MAQAISSYRLKCSCMSRIVYGLIRLKTTIHLTTQKPAHYPDWLSSSCKTSN